MIASSSGLETAPTEIPRRGVLKFGAVSAAVLTARWARWMRGPTDPGASERLGRVLQPQVEIRARPTTDAQAVSTLTQDEVVLWLRDVIGSDASGPNHIWAETPEGYVHSSALQPVRDLPNEPVPQLPATSLGPGMWVEISVPWVEFRLDNPPARSPWLRNTAFPRLYYGQVLWVDRLEEGEKGDIWYRVNERFGFGDRLWAPAAAFRPIAPEELAPIHPDRDDKRVVIRLWDQSLSCFEGTREVFFTRVSNGVNFDPEGNPIDRSSTPLGPHPIWRKAVSIHMVGGTTGGGWDLPGIGWTTLFVGNGVAIHSTYWHNSFGTPRSRGCVNARPEDAKWVFRWVDPVVPYDPGDVTVGMPGGTVVEVVES